MWVVETESVDNLEMDGDVGSGRFALADDNWTLVVDCGFKGRPGKASGYRLGGARQQRRSLATAGWNIHTT